MTTVTLEGTQELMKARETAVILATGGHGAGPRRLQRRQAGLRRRPGQRARVHRVARPTSSKAVRDIVTGKTFDNGLLCSSENSVVVRRAARRGGEAAVRRQRRALHVGAPRSTRSGASLVTPQRLPNPKLVGRPATYIAQQAGITVPPATRVLIAELAGVGRDYPAVDREALPRALLLCRQATGARAASAASRFCATAGWATRCPSTPATTTSSCSSA